MSDTYTNLDAANARIEELEADLARFEEGDLDHDCAVTDLIIRLAATRSPLYFSPRDGCDLLQFPEDLYRRRCEAAGLELYVTAMALVRQTRNGGPLHDSTLATAVDVAVEMGDLVL